MKEYFKLCGERRPEFMGWNQTELDKKKYPRGQSPVQESELSISAFGNERERYLECYAIIAARVKDAESLVRPELKDAYFAAIKYPVLAAEAHARKILRHSSEAYREIKELTTYYNKVMSKGKWNGLMDMQPHGLPVFKTPTAQVDSSDGKAYHPMVVENAIARNACDYQQVSMASGENSKSALSKVQTVQMLGHSMNAVCLPKNVVLTYEFTSSCEGDALLRVALIPTQPNDKGDLRFSVSVDGAEPVVFRLKEPFRSERWKINVLRGQAVREMKLTSLSQGKHTLRIQALDDHVVIDQWMIDWNLGRKSYLFPVK